MLNDFDDVFTNELIAYTSKSGKLTTFRPEKENRKMEERLINIRKLSPDLVKLLINNSKFENWPEFIRKKNKKLIKKLKCKYQFFDILTIC